MTRPSTLVDEVVETRRLLSQAGEIRRRNRVTQERMAREIPIDRTTLSRWESGAVTPTGRTRAAYLDLLRALEQLNIAEAS